MRYLAFLKELHAQLRPRVYLEIGVKGGRSLECALPGTHLIGVEPEPHPLAVECELYEMTSDKFFASHSPAYDLAFIDGMHLFEAALKDFINLERLAKDSVIMFHDCLPLDEVATSRERTARDWVGDVWKLVPILREYRPDLDLMVVDAEPSGLGVVRSLDPESRVLSHAYAEIKERFMPLEYQDALEYEFAAIEPSLALTRLGSVDTRA